MHGMIQHLKIKTRTFNKIELAVVLFRVCSARKTKRKKKKKVETIK